MAGYGYERRVKRMRGKVELEITAEDLQHQLRELVKETAGEEMTKMIRQTAEELVRKEIEKILEPLVLEVLTNEEFDFRDSYCGYKSKVELDDRIKSYVIGFLDQPCFEYSKSSSKPSERLHPSSQQDACSRLEYFLVFAIERYFDKHINEKMNVLVQKYLVDKGALQEIAKGQMKELLDAQI